MPPCVMELPVGASEAERHMRQLRLQARGRAAEQRRPAATALEAVGASLFAASLFAAISSSVLTWLSVGTCGSGSETSPSAR